MSAVWIALGWTGQALFFSRFFVQWLASERAGTSVAPRSFWWLSLVGTLLVGAYTVERGEPVLLPVFAINLAIYTRNLLLARSGAAGVRVGPQAAAACGLAAAGLLWWSGAFEPRGGLGSGWFAIGALGTAIWSSRFLLQWWASERAGESSFPASFWWTSLAGNVLLLAYAVRLGDPLYMAGFAIGPFVQIRNLVLLRQRAAGDGDRSLDAVTLPAPTPSTDAAAGTPQPSVAALEPARPTARRSPVRAPLDTGPGGTRDTVPGTAVDTVPGTARDTVPGTTKDTAPGPIEGFSPANADREARAPSPGGA